MIVDRDACWASIADHLCLQVLLSTSCHPQHDGQMEQQNQTLEITLHAYVAGSKSNWAKWLPALAFTYNSTVHMHVHGLLPFLPPLWFQALQPGQLHPWKL